MGGFWIIYFLLGLLVYRYAPSSVGLRPWLRVSLALVLLPAAAAAWFPRCLEAVRGEGKGLPTFRRAWAEVPAIRTGMLYEICVLGGLVLFIVPGVLWALRFAFWAFVVADTGLSDVAALRMSRRIASGHLKELARFAACAAVIIVLAHLPVGLALVVNLFDVGRAAAITTVIFGVVGTVVSLGVVGAWLGTSFAAAYDSLVKATGATETPPSNQG